MLSICQVALYIDDGIERETQNRCQIRVSFLCYDSNGIIVSISSDRFHGKIGFRCGALGICSTYIVQTVQGVSYGCSITVITVGEFYAICDMEGPCLVVVRYGIVITQVVGYCQVIVELEQTLCYTMADSIPCGVLVCCRIVICGIYVASEIQMLVTCTCCLCCCGGCCASSLTCSCCAIIRAATSSQCSQCHSGCQGKGNRFLNPIIFHAFFLSSLLSFVTCGLSSI